MSAPFCRRTRIAALLLVCAACGGSDGSGPQGDAVLITATPGSMSLVPGGSGSARVVIERPPDYDGAVGFEARGVPDGLGVSVAPDPATGTEATLTIAADAGMAAGEFEVDLLALAPGHAEGSLREVIVVQSGPFILEAQPAPQLEVTAGGAKDSVRVIVVRRPDFVADVAVHVRASPISANVQTTHGLERDAFHVVVDPGRADEAMRFTVMIDAEAVIGGARTTLPVFVVVHAPGTAARAVDR